MKIQYIKMENSVSEVTEKGNNDLFSAYSGVLTIINSSENLHKAEKLDNGGVF